MVMKVRSLLGLSLSIFLVACSNEDPAEQAKEANVEETTVQVEEMRKKLRLIFRSIIPTRGNRYTNERDQS